MRFCRADIILTVRIFSYFRKISLQRTKKILAGAYKRLFLDLSLPVIDLVILEHRLEHEGLKFLTTCLPLLEKALLAGLENGYLRCPTNFCRTKALPKFLGSLFCKIFDYDGKLKSKADPGAVAIIRQVCSYAYKADLPRDIALDNRVIDNFILTENELKELTLFQDPLTNMASCFVQAVFNSFDIRGIMPIHGPGATAEVSRSSKFDRELCALNSDFIEMFGHLFSFNYEETFDRPLLRDPLSTIRLNHVNLFNRSAEMPSRVILVNKDSRGPRLICAEPSPKMFVQQGVRLAMEDAIGKSALTAGHINFSDQGVNRDLANIGSLPCVSAGWATLDLKDASDRVSMALVKSLFSGVPDLFRSILVLRPKAFLMPDGSVIESSKHAPMGSALCFPVMSVSIWALLMSAFVGFGMTIKEASASIYVFGDDIIVPQHLAIYSSNILQRYGLKVNTDKSFYRGYFRESCGADFFLGVDNTPIRLKNIWWLKHVDHNVPQWYEAFEYVKHAQVLQHRGYTKTSEYWYSLAERIIGLLPYGTEKTSYLVRIVPANEVAFRNEALMDRLRIKPKVSDVFGHRTRQLIYRVYKAVPVMESKPTTGWGHFKRVYASIGSQEVETPYGEFARHNDFKMVRSKTSLN